MEWAEETIVRLRELWDEGHSTAQIALRLGVSKNAVVGKAHRLDLPARPSPIKREGAPPPPSQPRPGRPRRLCPGAKTLPPLSSAVPTPHIAPPPPPDPEPPVSPPVVVARPQEPTIMRVQRKRRHDGSGCCFPIGEPGTKTFRYCDADLDITGEYCPEHHRLTVQKVRRPSRALDEAA
jgi:GcrA cell cycle regulator